MALNLRQAIAGLRAQLAQVEAAIADFERLRRTDAEFRREQALRRSAKKVQTPKAGDSAAHSGNRLHEYDEGTTEVSNVIWR
jgi:hypothetical protein